MGSFLGFRAFLFLSFACMLSLPFTLFRIIVAQEILGREEDDAELEDEGTSTEQSEEAPSQETQETDNDGMPAYAWRGKGFAVIAAWAGLFGTLIYALGTLASAIYLSTISSGFGIHTSPPANFSTISSILTFITNALGGGLLALAFLFFGATIARRGRNLWPGIWVVFGYMALAVAALFSASAVGAASAPTDGQATLTSPAILLFALWTLWFGVMLVRLKPEA